MADKELAVLLAGDAVGSLTEDRHGRHWFTYASVSDHRLSVAMPRRREAWGPAQVDPFLEGLLPESAAARRRIADRFDVNPHNPFALLTAVGLDCAGAVQFVPPGQEQLAREGQLEPITEVQIARRLQELIDATAPSWQTQGEHWSLGGVQLKIALQRTDGRWYQTSGAAPTTHIIKPGIANLHAQAFNEAACLTALSSLGLPTAHTEYHEFDGIPAIVSARWDRELIRNDVVRVPAEDLCQALSVLPDRKYQTDGGPTPEDIVSLFSRLGLPVEDSWRFVDALICTALLGATDGHAKNYSLIEPLGERPRLAPLYDVASLFPYDHGRKERRLAMRIGSRYAFDELELRHWTRFAAGAGLDADEVAAHVAVNATDLPDALSDAAHQLRSDNRDNRKVLDRLVGGVAAQCARVSAWFA